jgi:hypothetical protein
MVDVYLSGYNPKSDSQVVQATQASSDDRCALEEYNFE